VVAWQPEQERPLRPGHPRGLQREKDRRSWGRKPGAGYQVLIGNVQHRLEASPNRLRRTRNLQRRMRRIKITNPRIRLSLSDYKEQLKRALNFRFQRGCVDRLASCPSHPRRSTFPMGPFARRSNAGSNWSNGKTLSTMGRAPDPSPTTPGPCPTPRASRCSCKRQRRPLQSGCAGKRGLQC
jgi:hypothetical protein